MSPEAAQGYYRITAWDKKNQQISHSFEIKEYGQNQDLTFVRSAFKVCNFLKVPPHVSFSSTKIWSEHRFSICYNHPGQRGHSESLCKVIYLIIFADKLAAYLCKRDMFSLIKYIFTVFRYTYGKPVLGSVNAEVCGHSYDYYWRRPYPGSDIDPGVGNVCKTYSMMVRYPLHTQNCYLLGL